VRSVTNKNRQWEDWRFLPGGRNPAKAYRGLGSLSSACHGKLHIIIAPLFRNRLNIFYR
jgi:hypothetical protein